SDVCSSDLVQGLTPAAERQLLAARWDGNVRELKNVIERACMLSDGTLVSERELAGAFGPERTAAASHAFGAAAAAHKPRDRESGGPAPLEAIQREHILDVLRQGDGHPVAAAEGRGPRSR